MNCKIIIIIISVISMLIFSSCKSNNDIKGVSDSLDTSDSSSTQPEYKDGLEDLDPELALKVRKDYMQYLGSSMSEFTLEDIKVSQYYGNYNGCEAVRMSSPLVHDAAQHSDKIAGYVFRFSCHNSEIYMYKDSNFYTLKGAYYQGLISKEDVYAFGQRSPIFLEENPNPDTNIESNLDLLEPERILEMRKDYCAQMSKYSLRFEDVWVNQYLGEYSGL